MARLEEIQAKIEQNQAALRDILAKRGADGRFPDDVKEQLKRAKEEYAALKEDAENERIAAKLEQELALSEFHQRSAQTSHTGVPENRQNTDTT